MLWLTTCSILIIYLTHCYYSTTFMDPRIPGCPTILGLTNAIFGWGPLGAHAIAIIIWLFKYSPLTREKTFAAYYKIKEASQEYANVHFWLLIVTWSVYNIALQIVYRDNWIDTNIPASCRRKGSALRLDIVNHHLIYGFTIIPLILSALLLLVFLGHTMYRACKSGR